MGSGEFFTVFTVRNKSTGLPPSVTSGARSGSPSPGSSAFSSSPPDPDPFSPAASLLRYL